MLRKIVVPMFAVGILGLAVMAGALNFRTVLAAEATPTVQAAPANDGAAPGRGFKDEGRGGPQDAANQQELAAALGITVDQLTAATQKAHEAALAQAVEQGLITQAQADQLKANGEPFGGPGKGWGGQNSVDFDALLADAMGISVEKLQAAQTQAFNTRIDQQVTDGQLTQEQADLIKGQRALATNETFQASMQSAYETAVQQAVKDGVITQAQADQILANATNQNFGERGGFGGPGGGRGHGGHGGPGGDRSNPPVVPTTTP